MKNLKNLSTASAPYKGISISQDLTLQQRQDVKQAVSDEKHKREQAGKLTENWRYRVVGLDSKIRVISLN